VEQDLLTALTTALDELIEDTLIPRADA